jgi:polysaccharide export outer membrane protein
MFRLIYITSILLSILSCSIQRKKIIYFNDTSRIENEKITFEPTYKKDDILGITISGGDENTLKLLNSANLLSGTNKSYTSGTPVSNGYLIDNNGEINLPLIGKIKVEGLTRSDLISSLEDKLMPYIKTPIVYVQIQNYRVTILGEVRNPGTYTIPNEKISLLELIGIAGDLTMYGVRKNILIIREENNVKKEYRIDLTKKDILSSKEFYLQQSDIVYIEPNRSKVNSSMVSPTAGIFISIASLIITTVNLLVK